MVIFYFLKNKDSANRMQWPKKSRRILFGIAEVQPILSKDNQKGWYLVRSVSPNLFSLQKFYRTAIKSFKPLTDSPVQSVFSKEITNPCSELSTHFFAKKVLVVLKNQYFAPTMWVHFSWRLQYKYITSHNHVYNIVQSGKGKISSKAS